MPLITWNDSLSVKVSEFDAQHKKLISMINELNDAMAQGKGKEVMGPILTRLADYTVSHFAAEEKLFAQHGYADTPAHKAEHANFIAKVTDFKADFEKGKLGLSIGLMGFLKDWLLTHIKGTDQKYSAFFNAKGLN